MAWTSTFLTVSGIAIAVAFVIFVIYYLASVANSAYQMRVNMRLELKRTLDSMKGEIEKEVTKRSVAIRGDILEEVRKSRGDLEALVRSLSESVAGAREDVQMMKAQVERAQFGVNTLADKVAGLEETQRSGFTPSTLFRERGGDRPAERREAKAELASPPPSTPD